MTEEVVYKKILRYTVIIIDLSIYLDRVVIKLEGLKIRDLKKNGLRFVNLYFLNYTWYMNDLHYI
jgi:hypothetical protein